VIFVFFVVYRLFEKTKPILVKNKRKKAKMNVNLEFIRVNSGLI